MIYEEKLSPRYLAVSVEPTDDFLREFMEDCITRERCHLNESYLINLYFLFLFIITIYR